MALLNLELPDRPALLESFLDLDQAILDAFPIGICACDTDGYLLRVNRKALLLWGRQVRTLDPSQRFFGSSRLETLQGDPLKPEEGPFAGALSGESFEGFEAVIQNPDGKRWVGRLNVAPLRDVDGVVVGAITCFQDVTREHDMRLELERQQRTFDLAMIASKMGTWRYTVADNICIYDDNAQRLYGLTEGRFLHDEKGVKAKFHPDDLAIMWARVAKALDPAGDGRYDVEYRVKQLDGNWRWLSAWGLVEFEGEGTERKPIAIAGASRDLTELKQAQGLQQLLNNELSHRVKNTLATVQSIIFQTLRGAVDLHAARRILEGRIVSLARVHDLLTERSWSGADLKHVVARAMAPFEAAKITFDGPLVEVSPKQALALSLALHELATNAVKYGSLSRAEGQVQIVWETSADQLHLRWREIGGPPVVPPSRRGFGSRLIEGGLVRDIEGRAQLEFAQDGVRCLITAALGRSTILDAE